MTILIDLAAEFTGKKAFKQAETATDKLTKSAKTLAKTLGVSFGTAAVLGYAKASVKAAAADQKAQKQLALALKNVGLERDAASAESYIQRLQSEFGVVDDLLRPSYQQLAVATRNSAEAQRLMGLALDLSASTGKDLSSVTAALSKAYLGNNTALTRLGVGISKADLKTKSFKEITDDLAKTFKGSATASAATFAGSLAKLGVASENVKEIIGTGIIDALTMLGDDKSVDNLATSMQDLATYTGDVIRGIGVLAVAIKNIPGLSGLNGAALVQAIPILGSYITLLNEAGAKARRIAEVGGQKNPIQSGSYLTTQKKITALTKEQAIAQAKILKDKKSQAILDKANLALNKATDVFDIDKIQNAAALTNQAEQLGKATNGAQLLQIANDVARLNVKRSILALEDAIASKDEAAIIAATAKLNADLKVLNTLGLQNVKMQDIKSILESLKPKDLINLANLEAAIALLQQLLGLQAASAGTATATVAGTQAKLASFKGTTASAFASLTPAEKATLGGYAPFVGSITSNVPPETFGGSGVGLGNNGTGRQVPVGVNITVNTGIGDPNAIAEAVDQVLQDAVDRGTLRIR